MKFAIETLQAEIDNCRGNEPIYVRSGNAYEAEMCRKIVADCEAAQVVLQRLVDRAAGVNVDMNAESCHGRGET